MKVVLALAMGVTLLPALAQAQDYDDWQQRQQQAEQERQQDRIERQQRDLEARMEQLEHERLVEESEAEVPQDLRPFQWDSLLR